MSAVTSDLRRRGSYRPLGELATQIRETVLPNESEEHPYIALEHIDTGEVVARRRGTSVGVRSAKFVFRRGDVLYGKLRPYLDKAVLAPFDGLASTELLVLRARPDVDPQFLAFAMHSRRVLKHAIDTTAGVNHPRTSWESLRALDMYCPPIDEQLRIARILSTIQQAKEANGAYLVALDGVRRTTIASAFAPRDRRLVSLGKLIERPQYGFTASASSRPGPRFLRITDITAAGVDWTSVPSCDPAPPEGERYSLQDGDLIVARIGATTGKAWLVRQPPAAVFASYLIRIRVRPGSDPRFIAAFFESDQYWAQIDAARGGRLKGGVNIENLNALQLPIVATVEQSHLGEALDAINSVFVVTRRRAQVLDKLFASSLEHLLGTVA